MATPAYIKVYYMDHPEMLGKSELPSITLMNGVLKTTRGELVINDSGKTFHKNEDIPTRDECRTYNPEGSLKTAYFYSSGGAYCVTEHSSGVEVDATGSFTVFTHGSSDLPTFYDLTIENVYGMAGRLVAIDGDTDLAMYSLEVVNDELIIKDNTSVAADIASDGFVTFSVPDVFAPGVYYKSKIMVTKYKIPYVINKSKMYATTTIFVQALTIDLQVQGNTSKRFEVYASKFFGDLVDPPVITTDGTFTEVDGELTSETFTPGGCFGEVKFNPEGVITTDNTAFNWKIFESVPTYAELFGTTKRVSYDDRTRANDDSFSIGNSKIELYKSYDKAYANIGGNSIDPVLGTGKFIVWDSELKDGLIVHYLREHSLEILFVTGVVTSLAYLYF